MRVILLMERKMEKEKQSLKMVVFLMAIGRMINITEKVFTNIQVDQFIKDNGKIIKKMD